MRQAIGEGFIHGVLASYSTHESYWRLQTAFYVRIGNGTREITDPAEKQKHIAGRWGSSTLAA